MYKEISEMSKDELASLLAMTRKSAKDSAIHLAMKYTEEGLKLELFQWITQEEFKKLSTYKSREAKIVRSIAEIWNCEESLSIQKTEEKIAEKVILEIVENLTSEQREKMAKAIEEKGGLSTADANNIKNYLLGKGKYSKSPLLLSILIPYLVETYPPLPLGPLFPFKVIFQHWIANRKLRKLLLGIIVALCVLKRIERKEIDK